MTRTWQQNSDAINGLWPQCQWTDEEIDLWREDLSGLDQDVLFEALREVKRSKDSLYPHLLWVHQAYRTLRAAKRSAERAATPKMEAFHGERLEIDEALSRKLAGEIADRISVARPEDVDGILETIRENIDRLDAAVASRLSWRAGAKRKAGEPSDAASQVVRRWDADDVERLRAPQLRVLRDLGEGAV